LVSGEIFEYAGTALLCSVVVRPASLVAKLAEKRKELGLCGSEAASSKSEQEKSDLRKSFKEKYSGDERITEKVISMALESVTYDEVGAAGLIDSVLAENPPTPAPAPAPATNGAAEKDKDESTPALVPETNTSAPDKEKPCDAPAPPPAPAPPAPAPVVVDALDQLDFEAE